MSARLFALIALTILAACNTYDESLLAGATNPAPIEDAGSGGKAGESHAGGSGTHVSDGGTPSLAGSGGYVDEPAAHAGASSAGSDSGTGGGAGSGGTPSTAGKGGAPSSAGSAGTPTAGASSGLVGDQIDDFEDQDTVILRLSMRNGPWYTVADATATGTVGPTMTIAALATADLRTGGTGTAALHLTAIGFADWGAGVGADMVNQMAKKLPYDVSAYRGIRFYAKVASGATSAVKVLFPNVYSDAE